MSKILNIGIWNIKELKGRENELVKELNKRNINIAVISETKKKLQSTKDIENYS